MIYFEFNFVIFLAVHRVLPLYDSLFISSKNFINFILNQSEFIENRTNLTNTQNEILHHEHFTLICAREIAHRRVCVRARRTCVNKITEKRENSHAVTTTTESKFYYSVGCEWVNYFSLEKWESDMIWFDIMNRYNFKCAHKSHNRNMRASTQPEVKTWIKSFSNEKRKIHFAIFHVSFKNNFSLFFN